MRGEKIRELEEARLADDAVSVAAGDHAELVAGAEMLENAARARHQFRVMGGVLFPPGAVGIVPTGAGQFCGAIDAIPIRGIMAREIIESPRYAHFAKHREIGG
jgi:hypothetical protein